MIIKICGITGIEDARHALAAGADWIGLNLVAGPRRMDIDAAVEIVDALAEPRRAVALIPVAADCTHEPILDELRRRGVRRVQLYGQVSPAALSDIASAGFEMILVRHVADAAAIDETAAFLSRCSCPPDYVLVDAADATRLGGTGRTANWAALAETGSQGRLSDLPPMLLAGGLTPDNVAEAIRRVSPAGVDVSSGVESSPGRKDQKLVERFIHNVRECR